MLLGLVSHLREKYRTAVSLTAEGYTQEEIAGLTGCTLGTVKSRVARGREELQRRLRRMDECP
jgi:RNA polymerase sigma-70 factor (ECF subfamily)